VRPGTLCRGLHGFIDRKVLRGAGAMSLFAGVLLGTVLAQLEDICFGHIRHIEHGLHQLGVEGLASGLLALDLLGTFQGLPHRLDCGGLEDLALSQGTDHALTTGVFGLGMAPVRQVFLDEPIGHCLSVGVVGVSVHLALDGFHLLHPDIR